MRLASAAAAAGGGRAAENEYPISAATPGEEDLLLLPLLLLLLLLRRAPDLVLQPWEGCRERGVVAASYVSLVQRQQTRICLSDPLLSYKVSLCDEEGSHENGEETCRGRGCREMQDEGRENTETEGESERDSDGYYIRRGGRLWELFVVNKKKHTAFAPWLYLLLFVFDRVEGLTDGVRASP